MRRAFLCGKDPYSGKCFSHRRAYIQRNLKDLSLHFCLKVIGSSIQTNHLHVVVKLDPFASVPLKPEQVVRRWRRIFPHKRDKTGKPVELTDDELMKEIGNTALVSEWRWEAVWVVNELFFSYWFFNWTRNLIFRAPTKKLIMTGTTTIRQITATGHF